MNAPVYLSDPVVATGEHRESLAAAHAAGRLVSDPCALAQGGFRQHYFCDAATPAVALARAAVAQLPTTDVDALIYATVLPHNAAVDGRDRFEATGDVRWLMNYSGSQLQSELELDAPVIGLDQQACTGLLGAVRIAHALIVSEGLERILCVTADRFPPGAHYEQAYNFVSDGAAACLVGTGRGDFRLLGHHQITNGALATASDEATLGSHFSYSVRAINGALAAAQLASDDVAWLVPQNTHRNAQRVLAGLLRLPHEAVFDPTLGALGHLIAGDGFANLAALAASGRLRPCDRLVMPVTGYGANWQCTVLEVPDDDPH
jgi:3-oxoacyl-[acyl-carrier-protein] synthase-3